MGLLSMVLAASTAAAESGDVPCDNNERADIWTATIPAGANVQIRVDTNDAATAFDPALDVIPASGSPWIVRESEYLGGGDDEFPCAEAPANNTACPLASGENGDWEGEVAFLVFNLGGCTGPTIGTYDVTLTVDASPATLTLAADDETVAFVFDGQPEPDPTPAPQPAPSPGAEPAAAPDAEPSATPDAEPAAEPSAEPDDGGEPGVAGCTCTQPSEPAGRSLAALGLVGLALAVGRRRRGGSSE